MQNACGIYLLRNTVSGKVYIGQSVHTWRRWHEHKKCAQWGHKSYLYDAIRKYGSAAFVLEVLEECAPLQFDEREAYWMQVYDALNPEKGYNYMPPGQRGRIMDADMREKIASKLRGKSLSPETVEKIRVANTGRKHSEETKQKIAAARKGAERPPEIGKKQAATLKIHWEQKTPEEKETYAAKRRGYKHTEEARQRMSLAGKGKPKSEATRERMRQAHKNEDPAAKERRLTALREASARRWSAYHAAKEAACL